jgi:hypothetical protein
MIVLRVITSLCVRNVLANLSTSNSVSTFPGADNIDRYQHMVELNMLSLGFSIYTGEDNAPTFFDI